jgi:hypothetical protein
MIFLNNCHGLSKTIEGFYPVKKSFMPIADFEIGFK